MRQIAATNLSTIVDKVTINPVGTNQHSDNVTTLDDDRGNTNTYALRKLDSIIAEKAKENYEANVGRPKKSPQNSAPITHIDTRQELARIAHVSHDTIAKVKLSEKIGLSSGTNDKNLTSVNGRFGKVAENKSFLTGLQRHGVKLATK